MRKLILALVLTTAVCLALAAVAAADPGAIQVSGQSATTAQQAGAASSATQVDPSNTNISIRVLSPGDDGSVSQSNTAASSASAGTRPGRRRPQIRRRAARASRPRSSRPGPTSSRWRSRRPPRRARRTPTCRSSVLSPGSDGSVVAGQQRRLAGHVRQRRDDRPDEHPGPGQRLVRLRRFGLRHPVRKSVGGHGAGSRGDSRRRRRITPSNTNVSIRVLSPGGDGSVSQGNSVGSQATSGNAATTGQTSTQDQGGALVWLQRFGLRHPDRRSVGGHEAGSRRDLDGDAGPSVEHERVDPGAQPR